MVWKETTVAVSLQPIPGGIPAFQIMVHAYNDVANSPTRKLISWSSASCVRKSLSVRGEQDSTILLLGIEYWYI
jgi:hypothetical protein